MSGYPPENPDGGMIVPHVIPDDALAYTGIDAWTYLVIGVLLILFGIWAVTYVGKQSDRHHKDS